MSGLNSFVVRNDATDQNGFTVNGATADIHQTSRGSYFYFSICAVMGASAIGILAASKMKPRTDRIFFYLSAALTFTACLAYFSMGSNLGYTPIAVEWQRSDPEVAGRERQVFYARYIDVR
jgi:bacteriorhodopsin